jgi:Ca2+-binding EF-hand superfamily protein
MSRCLVGLVLAVFCAVAAAGPKPPTAEHPESVAEHVVGVHSPEYDHEAFLGKAEAERFDQLPPAEARRRLGIIVDKIDVNKDGYVTEKELEEWVRHVANRYIMDDVMRQWEHYDADKDDYVTWDEFKAATFGDHPDDSEVYDSHRKLTYKDMMKRDALRFAAADLDGDKRLTKNELADFLHPEDAPHMQEIVLDETMDDMDKNKDGFVTEQEYVEDIWPQYEREAEGQEPEWLQSERQHFVNDRDKDGDGRLNKQELREWIMPENYDHAKAEATHLIYESDVDSDERLTKEEILQHQDVFVGSQATDFGDYLVRHDEF